MDPYFAVAYFQRGVSFFLQNNMDAAKNDFDQAYQVRKETQTSLFKLMLLEITRQSNNQLPTTWPKL